MINIYTKEKLIEDYDIVFNKFKEKLIFDQNLLESSRNIFDIDDKETKAFPKKLEVIALLGGLEFDSDFQESIYEIQFNIKSILKNKLMYLVKRENLGLELVVLKWPNQKRNFSLEKDVKQFLNTKTFKPFRIRFHGLQLHSDGCLVVRGTDENGEFRELRRELLDNFTNIPRKQSKWVHVPIGRILHQINFSTGEKLKDFILKTQNNELIPSQNIRELKMIHETQWYMEKYSILDSWRI